MQFKSAYCLAVSVFVGFKLFFWHLLHYVG